MICNEWCVEYATMDRVSDGHDVSYKVLLLGEAGVGKTSLLRCLSDRPLPNGLVPTIGIDFTKKNFEVDGVRVELQIWDTAGQERFRSITKQHYRGAKGIVLVYDVTDRNSFSMLDYWLDSIEKDIDSIKTIKEPIPVLIVGNKCDLDDLRRVTFKEGKKLSEKHFAIGFMETSAKGNIRVRDVFCGLAFHILEIDQPKRMNSYKAAEARNITNVQAPERPIRAQQQVQSKSRSKIHLTNNAKQKTCCST